MDQFLGLHKWGSIISFTATANNHFYNRLLKTHLPLGISGYQLPVTTCSLGLCYQGFGLVLR